MICSFQTKLFKEILNLVSRQIFSKIVFKKEMTNFCGDLSRSIWFSFWRVWGLLKKRKHNDRALGLILLKPQGYFFKKKHSCLVEFMSPWATKKQTKQFQGITYRAFLAKIQLYIYNIYIYIWLFSKGPKDYRQKSPLPMTYKEPYGYKLKNLKLQL